MTTTEEHLGRFYIELQAWIDGGCCAGRIFRRDLGLCGAALRWQIDNVPTSDRWLLWYALKSQFVSAGLDGSAPFESGDYDAWEGAANADALYTNPARLAWIKEHAEAAKAAGIGQEAA